MSYRCTHAKGRVLRRRGGSRRSSRRSEHSSLRHSASPRLDQSWRHSHLSGSKDKGSMRWCNSSTKSRLPTLRQQRQHKAARLRCCRAWSRRPHPLRQRQLLSQACPLDPLRALQMSFLLESGSREQPLKQSGQSARVRLMSPPIRPPNSKRQSATHQWRVAPVAWRRRYSSSMSRARVARGTICTGS